MDGAKKVPVETQHDAAAVMRRLIELREAKTPAEISARAALQVLRKRLIAAYAAKAVLSESDAAALGALDRRSLRAWQRAHPAPVAGSGE